MTSDELATGCAIAAVLVMAGFLAVYLSRWRRETIRFQCILFLVAFATRFTLSLIIYNTSLAATLGDEDALGWIGGALLESTWRLDGLGLFDLPGAFLASFKGINRGYAYWLGVYFFTTGAPYRLTAAVLSCASGALTAVFAYRLALALQLTPRGSARVGWWVCFLPSMLVWSSLTVKEPIVILLEVLPIYACLRIRFDGFSFRHAALCGVAIMLLMTLRFYAAYIVAGSVIASLAMPRMGRRGFPIISALFIVAVVALGLTRTGGGSSEHHGQTISSFSDMEQIKKFRQGMATSANTGFGSDIDTGTSSGLLKAMSLGWIFLLLAPFPWQLSGGGMRALMTMPEQLVWWSLFFSGVIPGLRDVRRRLGDVLPMVLFMGGLGLVYSITITNVGTLYRERAQLMPYLLVFASLHYDQRMLRKAMSRAARAASSVVWVEKRSQDQSASGCVA